MVITTGNCLRQQKWVKRRTSFTKLTHLGFTIQKKSVSTHLSLRQTPQQTATHHISTYSVAFTVSPFFFSFRTGLNSLLSCGIRPLLLSVSMCCVTLAWCFAVVLCCAVCRPATDLCDQEEKCTGNSSECPADQFKAPGAICRWGRMGLHMLTSDLLLVAANLSCGNHLRPMCVHTC